MSSVNLEKNEFKTQNSIKENNKGLISNSKKDEKEMKKGLNKKMNVKFVVSDETSVEILESYLANLNEKQFGRRVNWSDVLCYFVKHHGEKDIASIQESVMTKKDRVLKKLSELNSKNGHDMDIYDLAAKHLKIQ